MAHCNFTPAIQWDCITEIVKIIRAGELAAKKFEVIEHATCFIGCGAAMLRDQSMPDDLLSGQAADIPTDPYQIADTLAGMIPAEGNTEALMAVPWLEIAKVLLPLLIALLTETE